MEKEPTIRDILGIELTDEEKERNREIIKRFIEPIEEAIITLWYDRLADKFRVEFPLYYLDKEYDNRIDAANHFKALVAPYLDIL